MTHIETAMTKARQSDTERLDMLAYSAGWNAAADGDVNGHGLKVDLKNHPAFIEGAAAHRAQYAKARDFVPGSEAHVNFVRGIRDV